MAQPIQYTPQFIQTDVGAIQDKLNARQGQYDTAYASTLGAEDQFGQLPVHARDIDLKNKVIGGFKDRIKNLVDQYGGDYAAASKQLVKEIVNTKQDKFFGLAAERNKLAEEQRRLVQQYGPGAIVIKDVTKPDLVDAQGNYIKPEDLTSDVVSRRQLTDILDQDHGLLKNKSRESNVSSDRPGYYKSMTTQGITNNEVAATRDAMYQTLKKTKPELSDDMAMNIADAQARSYVLGSKSDYLSNKEWDAASSRSNIPPPPANTVDLFFENKPQPGGVVSQRTNDYRNTNTTVNQGAKMIDSSKAEIARLEKVYSDQYNAIKKANPNSPEYVIKERAQSLGTQHIPSLISQQRINLNKGRELYNSGENKFKENKTYKQLIESGVPGNEARNVVQRNIDETDNVFAAGVTFKSPNVDLVSQSFAGVEGSTKTKGSDGKYTTSKKTYTGAELNKAENVQSFGIDPGTETARWVDADGATHTLPLASSNNMAIKRERKQYKAVKEAASGKYGLGLTRINKDQSVTPLGRNGRHTGDGLYVYTDYENGKLVSEIVDIKGNSGTKSDLNRFTKDYLNTVAAEFGVKTEIQPDKVIPE